MNWWKFFKWFTISWWEYLLEKCEGWDNFWCRVKGHPHGIVFYNPNGLEPDTHCKDCGEDIG
ncbi:MAG: hypothetical protein AABY32_05015 [Nanoarchaeota archaeon]